MKPLDEAEAYKWAEECIRRSTHKTGEPWEHHHTEQLMDAIRDALLAAQDRGARSLPVEHWTVVTDGHALWENGGLKTMHRERARYVARGANATMRKLKLGGTARAAALCIRPPRKGGGV